VRDARELARKIGTMAPGTSVKLDLIDEGQEKTVTLTLGTLPTEKQAANQQKEHEVPDYSRPCLRARDPRWNWSDTIFRATETALQHCNTVTETALRPL
jgi:hypothetical protein